MYTTPRQVTARPAVESGRAGIGEMGAGEGTAAGRHSGATGAGSESTSNQLIRPSPVRRPPTLVDPTLFHPHKRDHIDQPRSETRRGASPDTVPPPVAGGLGE